MSRSNFFYKTIFSFIFFLPCIVFSQSISTYNKDNFLEQLNKDFNTLGIQLTEKEILANTRQNFINRIKEDTKDYFVEIANNTKSNGENELLSFLYYVDWLLDNNIKSNASLDKILLYHYYVIYNPTGNQKKYFSSLWDKINSNVFVKETTHNISVNDRFKVGVEDFRLWFI